MKKSFLIMFVLVGSLALSEHALAVAPSGPTFTGGTADLSSAQSNYGHYVRTGFTAYLDLVTIDPDAGATARFEIDWDNNGTVDVSTGFNSKFFGNNIRYLHSHIYPTAGTYTLSARAIDNTGAASAWTTWTYTIYDDNNNYYCYTDTLDEGPNTGSSAYMCSKTQGNTCVTYGSYASTISEVLTNTPLTRTFYENPIQGGSTILTGSTYYTCDTTYPPNVPTISGTNSVNAGTPTANFVTATHPASLNMMFDIDWDGNGTVDGTTGYFTPGSSVAIGNTYGSVGTYTVKARARDSGGFVSGWSTPFTITVNTASYNCETGSINPGLGIVSNNTLVGIALNSAMRWYHNVFYGACFHNTSGVNYFVPTKTAAELNSFINNLPSGVTKANGTW